MESVFIQVNTIVPFSYTTNNSELRIQPTGNLSFNTNYALSINTASIKDLSNNTLASSFTSNFTTALEPVPTPSPTPVPTPVPTPGAK